MVEVWQQQGEKYGHPPPPPLTLYITYRKKGVEITSARPEVQETADVGWREPIPPFAQSSSYSLTTLSSHVSTDRRAVTDMNGKTRTLRCASFLCRLRRRECCMLGAPSRQPTPPPPRTTSG